MNNEWIEIKYPSFEDRRDQFDQYFALYFKELVEAIYEMNEHLPLISEYFGEHIVCLKCHNKKLDTITERETYFLSQIEMGQVLYKWNVTHFKIK